MKYSSLTSYLDDYNFLTVVPVKASAPLIHPFHGCKGNIWNMSLFVPLHCSKNFSCSLLLLGYSKLHTMSCKAFTNWLLPSSLASSTPQFLCSLILLQSPKLAKYFSFSDITIILFPLPRISPPLGQSYLSFKTQQVSLCVCVFI